MATYLSGNGQEYDEGNFIIEKITKSFIYLKMSEEGYFARSPDWKIRKIPIKDFRGRKEPMPQWEGTEFICYHQQSGVPTIYKKLSTPLT